MRSGTSSFEQSGWFSTTLLKKNFKRFWPIWGIYTAILFFMLPVEILSRSRYNAPILADLFRGETVAAPLLGAVFGVVTAMALFSYLMDPKATQLLHGLPTRREGLFLTNWVSGLGFFLLPNLAILLITLMVGGLVGCHVGAEKLWPLVWLVVQTVIPMFFFCFAVFCAMFTGNLLALPVFYGILNVLVAGLTLLLSSIFSILLAGFSSGGYWMESPLVLWCTPVYFLFQAMANSTYHGCLLAVCYSLVLGAAFTLGAVGVYHLRQLERAGDLVTVGWVRPVFQYGFGTCVGLTLGVFLYEQFFYGTGSTALILLILLSAVVGAFAGRMLLKKTLRVFADGWKGVAVMAAVLAVLLFGGRADLFGYQKWVPKADKVASVEIRGAHSYPEDDGRWLNTELKDPELIRQLVEVHAALVGDLSRISPDNDYFGDSYDEAGFQTQKGIELYITYNMASGERIERDYDNIPITREDLDREGTYAALLEALINEPAVIQDNYLDRDIGLGEAVDAWLSNVQPLEEEPVEGEEAAVEYGVDTDETRTADKFLTAQEARVIWDAIREDLAAGRIGRRYLLSDGEREANCCYSDITLSVVYIDTDEDGNRNTWTDRITFTPQRTSTSTLKALEDLGYSEYLRWRE